MLLALSDQRGSGAEQVLHYQVAAKWAAASYDKLIANTKTYDGKASSIGALWRGLSSAKRGNMRTVEKDVAKSSPLDKSLKTAAAEEFQTTIIGMLGHDLRQSLQVIQGSYALLRSRVEKTPQQAWLDRGERAATKLMEQLNCLVDAFYLAERTNTLEMSSIGLGPILFRLGRDHEDAAEQKGIDLRVVTGNVHVVSNSALLGSILRNLLTNAIRYTDPGGRILVGTRRKGSEIRIDVYDTGIGIAAHHLPRIFDAFTRLSPERTDGLGLGLSIVRRALQVLGHRIEVRSSEGRGSLFSIYAAAPAATRSDSMKIITF